MEKDKCSLKIAPGQLVYTVYQQSVPGAKEGVREGGESGEREREREDGQQSERNGGIGVEKRKTCMNEK